MRRLFNYRDLLATLVWRELTVRYKRSTVGLLWTMLQPLLTMLVLHLVFSSIFRFDLLNYPVYVLAGLLFWNFFSQSIVSSMNSLRANAALLKKLPVPHAIFPVATVIAGVINLLLALVPLLGLLIFTGHPLTPALLFLPVAIFIATLFTLGAGLLLSPLAVFFYDIVEVVGVLITLALYLTPVIYPMSILPEKYRWLVRFNPLRSILEIFRDPIYYGKIPPISHISVAVAVALAAFALGYFHVPALGVSHPVFRLVNAMKPTIRLDGVSLRYRMAHQRINSFKEYALHMVTGALKYRDLWALSDVDLTIHGGEVVGIVGRNGAGKSTLLKVIAGVFEPTRGTVRVDGQVVPLLELGTGFDPELTGAENVFLNALLLGHSRRQIKERFTDIVEFAELGEFIDAPLRNYSSGMAARLGFPSPPPGKPRS